MRIGVAVAVENSLFSGGTVNAALAIAELCRNMGHDVSILNMARNDATWWEDGEMIRPMWEGRILQRGAKAEFDIVFEFEAMFESATERRAVAKRSVWIVRHSPLIHETEMDIFPIKPFGYCLEGLSEVWMWDVNTTDDDCQLMETLAGVPVRRVPYVWTPIINIMYQKVRGLPDWLPRTAQHLTGRPSDALPPWDVRIAETNQSSRSTCIFPIVALAEARRRGARVERWKVFNTGLVKESEFLRNNILRYSCDDVSGSFEGRQRIIEWANEPMSLVVSHIRFERLKPLVLDCMWFGIPVIHNSPALADLSGAWSGVYYRDNSVSGVVEVFGRLQDDFGRGRGIFSRAELDAVRRQILERYSPQSERVRATWSTLLESLKSDTVAPDAVKVAEIVQAEPTKTLTIAFTDFWGGFDPAYNFFTLLLESAVKEAGQNLHIRGISHAEAQTTKPDLLMFGPFGDNWKEYPMTTPKIFFTGENVAAPNRGAPDLKLEMGFSHIDVVDERYLRFPLWMMEIDWFGADMARLENPKPIPLEMCRRVSAADLARKTKFCAFVVTNPRNEIRNNAFEWLNCYKPVDSAGAVHNNMGDILATKFQGGGGGELAKVEFLRDYKFCLVFENESSPGYTTEKYLHAKAAGCIPIYWGDPKFERDFAIEGAIDARGVKTREELIRLVAEVDRDDSKWLAKYSVPALDDYRMNLVRRTLSEMARRILTIAGIEAMLPPFLGAAISDATPAAAKPAQPTQPTQPTAKPVPVAQPTQSAPLAKASEATKPETPVMATYASKLFLPLLQLWLRAIVEQKKAMPDLTVRVYLAPDIPEDIVKQLCSLHGTFTFIQVPSNTPPGFDDYWAPEHFAWKLWLYHTLVNDAALRGKMVFYIDCGGFLCRWPIEMMSVAQERGICLVEDAILFNRDWCHAMFQTRLAMTDAERDAHPILAGVAIFRAGAPAATRLFDAAYELSKERAVIAGAKWELDSNGKKLFRGHRHDQSILSILSQRQGTPRIAKETIYSDYSLRRTFVQQKSIYFHRGDFKVHAPIAPGIDDAYLISLVRREDRKEKFVKAHPTLATKTMLLPAFDGRSLTLTPALASLFAPNDFGWKKAVMGCALSHLDIWRKLANDRPEIKSYLIMEDDVVLDAAWETAWTAAQPHLPAEWDVVFLGGILPPNRAAFESLREPVNEWFDRMGLNKVYGQTEPTRYIHSCAYAYVLSRRGAQKILEGMTEKGGYWTSADHMMCSDIDRLNIYFLRPQVAKCYQDDDPAYRESKFNDFSRVDSFDSDLWNNNDRFSEAEIRAGLSAWGERPPSVAEALASACGIVVSAPAPAPAPTTPPKKPSRFVSVAKHTLDFSALHEKEWLMNLFGATNYEITPVAKLENDQILIVQRPHVLEAWKLLDAAAEARISVYVLHLSDEYASDDISFYTLKSVKKVVRTYWRPTPVSHKVRMIPLGYHWSPRLPLNKNPIALTPSPPFRELTWSFFGTDWKGRKDLLAALEDVSFKTKAHYVAKWDDPNKVDRETYLTTTLNSLFVPCPTGINAETFRFYEALECGAVPILVDCEGMSSFMELLRGNLGIPAFRTWNDAHDFMVEVLRDMSQYEYYRGEIMKQWTEWKERLGRQVREALSLASS